MAPDPLAALPGFAPERVASVTIAGEQDTAQQIPAVGAYMTPDHRYYYNGQGPVPSVTTILGVLDKPAVAVWKAKGAARAMYRALLAEDVPIELRAQTEDTLINWALREADKERDTAATLGSDVHRLADIVGAIAQTGVEGFQIADDAFPYVEAFRGFLDRYGGSQSIVSSEHMVWSLNGYAGTYDLLMQLPAKTLADGWKERTELWLIDIKTSKGYYPEYGLQLAAYRWADSIILPDTPQSYPMPEIQRAGVLHLRPDQYPDTGWRLIEYPITYGEDYLTFLGALEIWKWRESKRFTKSRLNNLKAQTP